MELKNIHIKACYRKAYNVNGLICHCLFIKIRVEEFDA